MNCQLTDDEINSFIDIVADDHNSTSVSRRNLQQSFDQVVTELTGQPTEKKHQDLFSRAFGLNDDLIPREHIFECIKSLNVPSLILSQRREQQQQSYFRNHSILRIIRAHWAAHGYGIIFLGSIIASMIVFAVLEVVKYSDTRFVSAFGYGVVVAKACTGALYPTLFFMTLSMSRYFTTVLRRSSHISRFLNLDSSRTFHIRMSCLCLVLATIHAISHLSGTFAHASRNENIAAVNGIIGEKVHGRKYVNYISSRPGLTGLVGLGLLYLVALLSTRRIRRSKYDAFQLGHLLLYPFLGLMVAHGTSQLLQRSIMGYVLALPTCLLLFERISRFWLGFYQFDASLRVLPDETIELSTVIPSYRPWDYTAGQYILVLVPAISFWQWHPFTISFCDGKTLKLHIKAKGDWTSQLHHLGTNISLAISGPFGAPAQQFSDFQYAIIIGAGIGITPFSAVLADLQRKTEQESSRPAHHPSTETQERFQRLPKYNRVDFHWIVRDGHYMSWLSGLLNQVNARKEQSRSCQNKSIDIRINTHITAQQKSIEVHVLSWLLETMRSNEHPESLLTGLLNKSCFGRPDFDDILDRYHEDMSRLLHGSPNEHNNGARLGRNTSQRRKHRVGVFHCGAAEIGTVLADKCSRLTARGLEDGSNIEYHFMVEAF